MWLLIAFLAVPLIEIALFIQVGGVIGLFPTLAIVIATALLGTYLVRQQGNQAMGDLRGSFRDLRDPTEPLAHGAMILVSAALLLTPGFFTDAVGFALLVPPIRKRILAYAKSRVNVTQFQMGPDPRQARDPYSGYPENPTIVEGEFEEAEVKPTHSPNSGNGSGWTRH